jgi:hypothetical protein
MPKECWRPSWQRLTDGGYTLGTQIKVDTRWAHFPPVFPDEFNGIVKVKNLGEKETSQLETSRPALLTTPCIAIDIRHFLSSSSIAPWFYKT